MWEQSNSWNVFGKYLNSDQVQLLRKAAKRRYRFAFGNAKDVAYRDKFLCDIALETGLRVEEISALKMKHIDLDSVRPFVYVERGKGGKSRPVRISKKFRKMFSRYNLWKKKIGEPLTDESPVFYSKRTDSKNTHLSIRAIQKAIKRLIRYAGLPEKFSIHSCRHTFATHIYISSGYNLRAVQKLLGHSNISVTQVYADVVDRDIDAAVENLYGEK